MLRGCNTLCLVIDGGLVNQRPRDHTIFMAFVTPGQNFFAGYSACLHPKLLDVLDGSIDFLLAEASLGHDPSDDLPVSRGDDGLAGLHLIEEPGKMGPGFRALNFSRDAF